MPRIDSGSDGASGGGGGGTVCVDTETTGLDISHGARPFFVTVCPDDGGDQTWWEEGWEPDVLTRCVSPPAADLQQVRQLILGADCIVGQNVRFDVAALSSVIPSLADEWPWHKTEDTLLAGHLLASNQRHDLTSMAAWYLGEDVEPLEMLLKEACQTARRMVQQARAKSKRHAAREEVLGPSLFDKLSDAFVEQPVKLDLSTWRIADEGLAEMPSCKGESDKKGADGLPKSSPWAYDMWLPRALWLASDVVRDDHPTWSHVLADYSNKDSEVTMALWPVLHDEMRRRKLLAIYEHRKRLLPIISRMQARGVTLSRSRLESLSSHFAQRSAHHEAVCVNLAKGLGYDLKLPRGAGNSDSLTHFCFGTPVDKNDRSKGFVSRNLDLPVVHRTEGGAPSLDSKNAIPAYLATLPQKGRQRTFVRHLAARRKVVMALSYMESYRRFWLPAAVKDESRQVVKVVSGGQIGADRAGLEAARSVGIATGGWCPAGWRTLRGSDESLADFGLRCAKTADHPVRTLLNVRESDATIRVAHDWSSAGERCTLKAVSAERKPHLDVDVVNPPSVESVQAWLASNHVRTLNVAGNGDQATYDFALPFLVKVLQASSDAMTLFPSLNPTGTDTLRFSCKNPNAQQINKQEEYTLRKLFGPATGREWWSFDYENLELRIPFYKSGEKVLIELFEHPDRPPYFGSQHLLNSSVVYAEEFARCLSCLRCKKEMGGKPDKSCNCAEPQPQLDGRVFKERYKSTLYQWAKNGDFALQYQCGEATADKAFHRDGAYRLLKSKFAKLDELNRRVCAFAEKHGYVETMPDVTVDPDRGYPLLCTRTEHGKVLSTIPLSYYIQGTAMWCTCKAMVRCQERLDEWRRADGFDGHISLQVHDELDFDFPKSRKHPSGDAQRLAKGKPLLRDSNWWRARELKDLMEESGADIGVPLTVSCGYHEHNWGEEVKL